MNKASLFKVLPWVLAVEAALGGRAYAQATVANTPDAPTAAQSDTSNGVSPNLPQASAPVESNAAATASQPDPDATGIPPPPEAVGTAEAESSGPKNRLIQEVIVTAGKREENLQKVASSVQAFSGASLDAKGVADTKDLQLVTPGLTYDSMASYSIIFIRGIGGDAFQAGIDSSVATYIDGLYLPFTFSAAQALGDVKQIEVLKGPQGTLYGRNAVAGAILVKLKEPSLDPGLDILAQVGDYSDKKAKVSVHGGIPFTNDTLAASASFLYENHNAYDIYYPDPSSDKGYKPFRNVGYRGALKWTPIDHLDIQFSYSSLKAQDSDSVVTDLLSVAPAFAAVLTPHTTPHESGVSRDDGVQSHTRIESLSIDSKNIDWFDAKLILGHTTANSIILFDYDSAPQPVLDISAIPNEEKSSSAELILESNPVTAPDWLQWIAGLYVENTDKTGRYPAKVDLIATAIGTPLSNNATGTSPICALVTQAGLDCTVDPSTNQNPLIEVPIVSGLYNAAKSVYGQLTFHVFDNVDVVGGGRASTEIGRLNYAGIDGEVVGGHNDGQTQISPDEPVFRFRKQEHIWTSFTPNAGVNYRITPDILAYYKYSEAFKSGNFNGLNINQPPQRVEPESAAGNEVGFKTELFSDRSVKFNGALFTTTIVDAQEQTLSLTSGGVTSLQNAGNYTVKGAEFEINWFATESLVFNINGVYLHGRYGEFIGRGFKPASQGGLNDENLNFKGNVTVRTPVYTATAGVNYTFNLPFGLTAEASSDVYYNDGFFYDPLNTVTQPSYIVVNARFGIYDPHTNIRVTGFGKNLANANIFTNKYPQDFGVTGIFGAPRTFGVTLNYSYGGKP